MENREAIEILSRPLFMDGTPKEILDAHRMAISALEKQEVEQEVDKCCETCKYEHLELDEYPCCDCIRAKDHYEPYTEEKA